MLPKNFAQGQLSSFTERQSLDDLKYICMRQIETREEKMCSGELISDGPEKEKDFTHKSSAMGITFDLNTCTWVQGYCTHFIQRHYVSELWARLSHGERKFYVLRTIDISD